MYKVRHTIPLLILISFTLVACTPTAEDPKVVAEKYWQDLQNGNTVEAEKLVSSNSRYVFSETKDRIPPIMLVTTSDAVSIVTTAITTVDPDNNTSHTETFDTVLVLEQGQWKVDVKRSQIPPTPAEKKKQLQQLSDELSESMRESIESIDESMTQGMQMLNEALQEGSKEMGDSLLNLMKELNSSMKESIDKLKQRRQQTEQEPQKEQHVPKNGEGMI